MGSRDGVMPVPDWQWNVWKINPKTGERVTWLGSIMDPKTGFEWLKRQGKKRDHFRINNVPPPNSRMRTPDYEVVATTATKRERGEDLEPKVIPGKYEYGDAKPERRAVPFNPANGPRNKKIARKPAKKKTAAQIEMEQHAAELLEQHKADEAAELAED